MWVMKNSKLKRKDVKLKNRYLTPYSSASSLSKVVFNTVILHFFIEISEYFKL